MTLFEAYQEGLKQLKNPELEEINLRILLCENNGLKDMSEFYIKKDENIRDLQRFNGELQRFLNGEPVQYIIGKASFLNEDFIVSKDVLIPRNETEEVVLFAAEKIKKMFAEKPVSIADVCTGSGCIGCSLYKLVNCSRVLFSDISQKAINIAKLNATNKNVQANFFVSDSLDYLNERVDVIISNPPYILKKEDVDPSVLKFEPRVALFADEELSVYRKIIEKGTKLNVPLMVFEIGYDLKDKLQKIICEVASGYKVEFKNDINNVLRICSLEKTY